jgi:hypothetical protein
MSSAALQNKANAAEIVTAVLPKQDITNAHSQRTQLDYTQISVRCPSKISSVPPSTKCLRILIIELLFRDIKQN